MKAGIYLGKEQIELRELPIPEVQLINVNS